MGQLAFWSPRRQAGWRPPSNCSWSRTVCRVTDSSKEEVKAKIHYNSPANDEWESNAETLLKAAPELKAECDDLGVTLLIVDSYNEATTSEAEMGGMKPAKEYFKGLRLIGRTSVTIAHVNADAKRHPKKPFGSSHVKNAARELWSIEKVGTEDIAYDHDTEPLQPAVVALEMKNQKCSERARPPRFLITFSFDLLGQIEVTTPDTRPYKHSEMVYGVMGNVPMTAKAISAAITEDYETTVTEKQVRKAIERDARLARVTDSRPIEWRKA